ncbi:uncharacterized protein RBU33_028951 [Hipposideros larvatus]
MGNSQSLPSSPLGCILSHFHDVYSQEKEADYGVRFSQSRLRTFCETDWPAFNVGWPPAGTFDRAITQAVWDITLGRPGHPDQFSYIDIWKELIQNPPKWLTSYTIRTPSLGAVLVARVPGLLAPKSKNPPPVLQEMPEDPPEPQLLLPPASLPPPLPPYPPPSPAPIYPPLPEPFPDSTVPEPPASSKALPPLSPSLTRRGSPYALTGGESQSPAPSVSELPGPAAILPLRQIQPGGSFIYVPFTTTDLYNWKHQNPPFSEKPQALISLLESVFQTHIPTWDDCQQPLQTLFTSEERKRILQEARKVVLRPGSDISDPMNSDRLQRLVPTQRPDWDPTTDAVLKADTQDYRPVQDLREVNKRVETIHPTVPNPYTLLSLLPPDHQVYTVLDLKDAFFSIPLAPSLQALQTLQTELLPIIKATQPDNGPLQPHPFLPGDTVLVRRIPSKTLEPTWKGPYVVTLTTPTALKVAGISTWIHHTQVKPAPPDPDEIWKILSSPSDQKIRLGRVPS